MAITRPVTKTIISTTDWGIPVTDAVNANAAAIAALQPGPWINLPLVNGYSNENYFAPAQYRKRGDTLELASSVTGVGASGLAMCTLPAGYRPRLTYRIATLCYSGTTNTSHNVRSDVTTDGIIAWYDIPAGALFIILTGITIPLN